METDFDTLTQKFTFQKTWELRICLPPTIVTWKCFSKSSTVNKTRLSFKAVFCIIYSLKFGWQQGA